MYRQYHLTSGNITTTAWLETPAPLRTGVRLTTKEHGSDRIWAVVRVGRIERKDPPDRRWRVGGLL